jgi:pyruvate formate lyase activating enzyme
MGAAPELAYYAERCLESCRQCLSICPEEAIRDDRARRVDFARCTLCGLCVDVCPAESLVRVGREVGAEDLLAECLRDRTFYETTGGGITLSGGEPVLQSAFLGRFLPLARQSGLHTAVETAGYHPFEALEPLLPYLDLIVFDLKIMDPERHVLFTTRTNERIHDNLGRLIAIGAPLRVRMPVVPGRNTDDANVEATAAFLAGLGVHEIELLPYNHLWEAKLPRLAEERLPLGLRPPEPAFYTALRAAFARSGLQAI